MSNGRIVSVGTWTLVGIAVLLFVEALCAGIIPITQKGAWPDQFQWVTILLVAVVAAVTYLLSILKGKPPEPK